MYGVRFIRIGYVLVVSVGVNTDVTEGQGESETESGAEQPKGRTAQGEFLRLHQRSGPRGRSRFQKILSQGWCRSVHTSGCRSFWASNSSPKFPARTADRLNSLSRSG